MLSIQVTPRLCAPRLLEVCPFGIFNISKYPSRNSLSKPFRSETESGKRHSTKRLKSHGSKFILPFGSLQAYLCVRTLESVVPRRYHLLPSKNSSKALTLLQFSRAIALQLHPFVVTMRFSLYPIHSGGLLSISRYLILSKRLSKSTGFNK